MTLTKTQFAHTMRGGGVTLLLAVVVAHSVASSTLHAQYVEVDDSLYIPSTLAIWFKKDILNKDYLCIDSLSSQTGHIQFSGNLFLNTDLYVYLSSLNVISVRKGMPHLSPCEDTLSLSRSGDTIRVPDFWNILIFEFDDAGWEMDIPNKAVEMTIYHQHAVRIAEPLFIAYNYIPEQDTGSLRQTTQLFKAEAVSVNDPKFNSVQVRYESGPWSTTHGIDVSDAWKYSMGNSQVLVGVIDDGVCARGPGNALVGHEALGAYRQAENRGDVVFGAANYEGTTELYYKDSQHGTRVAGTIAAITNDVIGTAGIAGGSSPSNRDNVRIAVLKTSGQTNQIEMASAIVEGATKSVNPYAQREAPHWACDILSLSSQIIASGNKGFYEEILRAAVAYSYMNDVPICNSVGNTGDEYHQDIGKTVMPGSADENHIVVVGLSNGIVRSSISSYGEILDFMAPQPYTPMIMVDVVTKDPIPNTFDEYIGSNATSWSTPVVTGVFALLKSELIDRQGTVGVPFYLAPEDYVALSAHNASLSGNVFGAPLRRHSEQGYGVINAHEAVRLLSAEYELLHYDVNYSVDVGLPHATYVAPIDFPEKYAAVINYQGLLYNVKQYKITKTGIPLPAGVRGQDLERVWARGRKSNGLPRVRTIHPTGQPQSTILPLYFGVHWAEITGYTSSTFDVETYIYSIADLGSGNYRWMDDITPSNLSVAISVLQRAVQTTVRPMNELELRLSVYPTVFANSVRGYVTVEIQGVTAGFATLSMYDALGRCVDRRNVGHANTCRIDTGTLSRGVHYVVLTDGNVVLSRSIYVF